MFHTYSYRITLPNRATRLFLFRGSLLEVVQWAQRNFDHARICSCCHLIDELREWTVVLGVAKEQQAQASTTSYLGTYEDEGTDY